MSDILKPTTIFGNGLSSGRVWIKSMPLKVLEEGLEIMDAQGNSLSWKFLFCWESWQRYLSRVSAIRVKRLPSQDVRAFLIPGPCNLF